MIESKLIADMLRLLKRIENCGGVQFTGNIIGPSQITYYRNTNKAIGKMSRKLNKLKTEREN